MANPLVDFLDEYGEKKAEPMSMWRHGGNALAQGLGAAAGTAALTGGAVAAQHIYNAITAKRDFRGMMEWNQDLRHEDQRLVNQSYRTLRQFAPDMAKDPMVAGSMVRQMVQSPQGAAGIMQQALQGQRNVGSPVLDSYSQSAHKGVTEGMKRFGPFGAQADDKKEP